MIPTSDGSHWKRHSMQIFKCEWHPWSYPRSWAQWRHCRAAAGCGITVIRWRGPGFTGLVASVVRDPPCSEHPARVSTVMGEKLQTDNWDTDYSDSFSEIKLQVRITQRWYKIVQKRVWVNLNFVKPLEWVLCGGERIAPSPAAVSSAPTFQHQPLQQPNNNNSSSRPTAVTTTPGTAVGCGLIFIQSRPLHPEIDPNSVVV